MVNSQPYKALVPHGTRCAVCSRKLKPGIVRLHIPAGQRYLTNDPNQVFQPVGPGCAKKRGFGDFL